MPATSVQCLMHAAGSENVRPKSLSRVSSVFMRPLEISHGYALFLQFYMWKLSKTSSERREKGRFNKSYCVLAFSYT